MSSHHDLEESNLFAWHFWLIVMYHHTKFTYKKLSFSEDIRINPGHTDKWFQYNPPLPSHPHPSSIFPQFCHQVGVEGVAKKKHKVQYSNVHRLKEIRNLVLLEILLQETESCNECHVPDFYGHGFIHQHVLWQMSMLWHHTAALQCSCTMLQTAELGTTNRAHKCYSNATEDGLWCEEYDPENGTQCVWVRWYVALINRFCDCQFQEPAAAQQTEGTCKRVTPPN